MSVFFTLMALTGICTWIAIFLMIGLIWIESK